MTPWTRAVPHIILLAMAPGAYAIAAVPPQYARLPYSTTPLAQPGSGNLLPNAQFARELDGWNPRGDVSGVTLNGEPCLRFGPPRDAQAARIAVWADQPNGDTLYLLTFEAKIPPDTQLEWDANYPGLHGWFSHAKDRNTLPGCVRIRHCRRGSDWVKRYVRLFTAPDIDAVYVLISAHINAGAILTRRWRIVREPIAADEGRVILEAPSGSWAEAPHSPQPPAPEAPTLWCPSDSDRLRPYTRPTTDALDRPLELAGTPGEMCIGSLALYTPQKLSAVTLAFTDLESDGADLAARPTAKWIVWHPRRTDFYGRGRTFHYVADFFVNRPQGVDCPANETTAFWINLRIPEAAAPGLYLGHVRASIPQRTLSVPVRLRVYPFQLAQPQDAVRYIYLDNNRWRDMTDDQVLAELADVQDHGYQSVSLSCRGAAVIQHDRITDYDLSEEAKRAIVLVQRAELQGPFLFWTGWLPGHLARQIGLPAEAIRTHADNWPEELADAAIATLKLMKRKLIELGIEDPIMVAVDEPGYWKKGSPERLAWDVSVAHAAGWPVYCTSSYLPSDPIGQDLEYHCYGGNRLLLDQQHAAFIAHQTRQSDQKLWYYCTGAYSGQIGNVVRNRYLGGFFFYRCGADGTASWTFQRPRGNPFDDFGIDERAATPTSGQPCIVYPDPEHPGENLDTPHWEGLRQAHYDYCYAETLARAIEMGRERDPARAQRAHQRLDDLMAGLPWNGKPFPAAADSTVPQRLTNPDLSTIRAQIADEIAALAGE